MPAPYSPKPNYMVESDGLDAKSSPDHGFDESSMEHQLQELDGQIKMLMAALAELETKLEPVMIVLDEESEDSVATNASSRPMTPTSLRVFGAHRMLYRLRRRVEFIYDCVDV